MTKNNSNFVPPDYNFENSRILGVNCPPNMPNIYHCFTNAIGFSYVVGPKMNIQSFNLNGADLRNVDLRDIYGNLETKDHCPSKLPYGWVCAGSTDPYRSYTLYGPDSYFEILDLGKIIPTTNSKSRDWLNLTNSRFGKIIGELPGDQCLTEEQMPDEYKCLRGKFYGLNAELDDGLSENEAKELTEDLDYLDGMSFITTPMTKLEKKYKILKGCEMTNKAYFDMCEHLIYSSLVET